MTSTRSAPTLSRVRTAGAAAAVPALSLAGTALGQGVTDPSGPAAGAIADLWWLMFIIAAAVVVIVLGLFLFAVSGGRRERGSAPPWSTPFIVVGGIAIPAVILVGVLIYALTTTAALAGPGEEALTIEVVGHQWWWEVRYPEQDFVTANEIHIPTGVPVRLELTSVDVIHSFWVPTLNGKMDLVPGQVNEFWIQADEPGIYRGSCAEYCGVQHAKMNLLVSAYEPDAFRSWLAGQSAPAVTPDSPLEQRGREVFLGSACVYCHTVRGTNATGKVGPDLTHIASRLSLGAGTIANNRGNLGGWIVNSQAIKPGNRMPPMYLESDELLALLTYLESLE